MHLHTADGSGMIISSCHDRLLRTAVRQAFQGYPYVTGRVLLATGPADLHSGLRNYATSARVNATTVCVLMRRFR